MAWWRDFKIYRSKDVPWSVKCKRMVEHVSSVFCFGSENWSWSRATLERIVGWETKGDETCISIQKMKKQRCGQTIAQKNEEEEEMWADYCTIAARFARKMWTQMKLPFLSEVIAENMWRAMGWVCDQRQNAVSCSLKQVFRWEKHEMVAVHKGS